VTEVVRVTVHGQDADDVHRAISSCLPPPQSDQDHRKSPKLILKLMVDVASLAQVFTLTDDLNRRVVDHLKECFQAELMVVPMAGELICYSNVHFQQCIIIGNSETFYAGLSYLMTFALTIIGIHAFSCKHVS